MSADVQELRRILALAEGFILMPVEVAGPDAAPRPAAMVEGATAHRATWTTTRWAQLVARLLDAAAPMRAR